MQTQSNIKAVVTDDELKALWAETPSSRKLSRLTGIPESTIRSRIRKLLDEAPVLIDPDRAAAITQLAASIPHRTENGGQITKARVTLYGQAAYNHQENEWVKEGLNSVSASYSFRANAEEPKFPLIQPATPTVILYADAPRILRKTYSIPIISDAQIGFLRDADTDELEPTHDPLALDVAKQIVQDVQPRKVVYIGDWVDWPVFSRWQQYPEYDRVVQPSIEAAYQELGEMKSAAGKQCVDFVMIGSNHGYRPEKFLLEHNKAALYIRRAGSPAEWPVFSEPFLLRYDELGITFSGQYPGGEHYILPDLVAMHAPPKSKEFGASVVHGHTHKLQRTPNVQHRYDGRKETFTVDVGCLCQTGTAANKKRLLVMKVPGDRGRTDWIQGIAVVNVVEGKFPSWSIDEIHISQGTAVYCGQQYVARQLEDALEAA